MAKQYGDTTEPGIITEETSASNIDSSVDAPSDVCIVGPADLANATDPAVPNQVYEITRDTTAVSRFGEDSLLTEAILDMLTEGSVPIYAVATEQTAVTDEDHGAVTSTTVSLDNVPTTEDAADFTVTLDNTELTPILTRDAVADKAPDADEVYINPVDAELEVPTSPDDTSGLTVDYTWNDYPTAFDAVETNIEAAEAIDFLSAIQENAAVQQGVRDACENLSEEQNYTIAFVAPNTARIGNVEEYENTYDTSRVQVVYPSRFADGTSSLAAYAGVRGKIGLDRTAIGQRFKTNKELDVTLNREQRGALIEQRVVPLENRVGGAEIKDDKTSVSADNAEEANIDFGFKRLVLDYVYDTARQNERPFIGRLNQRKVRNALEALIKVQLTALKDSNLIESYSIGIFEESSTKARLELSITAPDPLRFIENDVTVGSSA